MRSIDGCKRNGMICEHVYGMILILDCVLQEIFEFVESLGKRLTRGLEDLDDVRLTMAALEELRHEEIRIDSTIGPVEEAYSILNKFV